MDTGALIIIIILLFAIGGLVYYLFVKVLALREQLERARFFEERLTLVAIGAMEVKMNDQRELFYTPTPQVEKFLSGPDHELEIKKGTDDKAGVGADEGEQGA